MHAMRFLLPLLTLFTAFTTMATESAPLNPAGFIIHRGTNISHWLSQDFRWAPREAWFTEQDVQFIAAQGFDHVRLPVDEPELWLENGKPNEPEFERLLTAIGWIKNAKLRVIVDLHTVKAHHFNAAYDGKHNTLWTDPKAQEHFLGLWRELSARLRSFPVDFLAYEVLNEAVADTHEQWNALLASAIKVIRENEPSRVIVTGANMWQMPQNLPFLTLPAGDKNLILSFHTYTPMLFTHYRADWTPLKSYTGKVSYPGPIVGRDTYEQLMKNPEKAFTDIAMSAADDWGQARMLKEYEPAIRHARELGLQLYCGEFGVMPTVPRADRLAYYRDIVAVFETQGIAWANWEYKGDFGIYEWHGLPALCGKPDKELIRALLQKKN